MLDRRSKVKIAYWYYKKHMTQEEIARRLGCSRQRVNKAVQALVADGIVSIAINGLENEFIQLENELEQLYSLKQVLIADTSQSELPPLSVLGKRAADFLDEYIQDGKTIGVSWGNTLGEAVRQMRDVNKRRCQVVQLVGGLNGSDQSVKPDEITRLLAGKLSCNYSILYAPAIMNSEIARTIMAQQDFFQDMLERMQSCDMAVVGVGQLDKNATIVRHGHLSGEDLLDMLREGYVGDICFNHYRADGSAGDFQLQNRMLGVDLFTLRTIPEVVAIAGGAEKAAAVRGALNTGSVDVLITDIGLAKELAAIP